MEDIEYDEEESEEVSGSSDDKKDSHGMIKALKRRVEKKYEIVKLIGKGSYGCVTKAKCKETGRFVALKVMKN